MEEVLRFLEENPVFYFATMDGDQPRVRPFGLFMEFEGKLYFAVGNQKVAYQQLKANPKFELSTTSKDGYWIRIHGKAVFDDRPNVIEKAFELFPDVRGMYSKENGPRLAPFYVAGGEAIIANMRGDSSTIAL